MAFMFMQDHKVKSENLRGCCHPLQLLFVLTRFPGMPVELTIAAIRKVVDVAMEVNKRRGSQQIKFIDIGGGYEYTLLLQC
jgi:hypothetical protein